MLKFNTLEEYEVNRQKQEELIKALQDKVDDLLEEIDDLEAQNSMLEDENCDLNFDLRAAEKEIKELKEELEAVRLGKEWY